MKEAATREEQSFLRDWYARVYIPAERRLVQKWLPLQRQLAVTVRGKTLELNEELELRKLNSFLERLWPKYHYVALQQMAEKFRRQIE